MSSAKILLSSLLIVLSPLLSVWALLTEPYILSIPVCDIVKNDLSAYKAYPNFMLYSRWLGTPQGSYIGRDPCIYTGKGFAQRESPSDRVRP